VIDIRIPGESEHRAGVMVTHRALLEPAPDEDTWGGAKTWHERDRAITAWDGSTCVGFASQLPFEMVVPGGASVATAGLSYVGVAPTHTRRGVLTQMIDQLHRTARARGEVLASLGATEAVIYGRFGYGVASTRCSLSVDAHRARIAAPSPDGLSWRLLDRSELMDVLPPLYERIRTQRPAAIGRTESMWRDYLEDLLGDEPPRRWVYGHMDTTGAFDGYVDVEATKVDSLTAGRHITAKVIDLWGTSPAVERELWRIVLTIDRVDVIEREECPLDDVLRWSITDQRAVRTVRVTDEQWLRMFDVEACLSARTYRPGDPVVIAVDDPLFADNAGPWRIDASGATRTDATADIRCPIAAISSAYLGGTTWRQLAAGGSVVGDADAIARADVLFATSPMPFCGSMY
jgi:predicted acetyltransferase